MHGSLILTFEMPQHENRGHHYEVYCRIAKKAESLAKAPLPVIAYIGKQSKEKVYTKEQYQPEYIILYWEQQSCNVGKSRCYNQFNTIHNFTPRDI